MLPQKMFTLIPRRVIIKISSQLILFNAVPVGAIEVLFDEHNQLWFKCAHIGKYLELPDIHKSLSVFNKCKTRIRSAFKTNLEYYSRLVWTQRSAK